MIRPALACAAALALSACVVTAPPVVTDFNGASVKMNTDALSPYPNAATNAEAARICGMDAKRPEYASSRPIQGGFEHLYLCL